MTSLDKNLLKELDIASKKIHQVNNSLLQSTFRKGKIKKTSQSSKDISFVTGHANAVSNPSSKRNLTGAQKIIELSSPGSSPRSSPGSSPGSPVSSFGINTSATLGTHFTPASSSSSSMPNPTSKHTTSEPSFTSKMNFSLGFSLPNQITKLKKFFSSKKINKTPFQIKNFKNINQYIKKDFIYIDITQLLGETFINSITDDNCFEKDILLKTIAYSLTSNNERDKPRIIYFLQKNSQNFLYVYNTKEYKSYKKEIT
jgi:hypothetical protein